MADLPRSDQLPARRRVLILDQVRRRGAASIQELAETLGVSLSTVRRDLDLLTSQGVLARTHGGALIEAPVATFEPDNSVAAETARPQKAAIGREAARRIAPGASVLADAGSTVEQAVRALVAREVPFTLVTNSLATAQIASAASAIRIMVTGGTLRPGSPVLTGEPGLSFLARLHADVCLLGAHAISGLVVTESSIEGAQMKRAMQRAARRTLLLADSSKFGQPAFCTVGGLGEVAEVITDDGIAAETLAGLRDEGILVTTVPVAQPGEGRA